MWIQNISLHSSACYSYHIIIDTLAVETFISLTFLDSPDFFLPFVTLVCKVISGLILHQQEYFSCQVEAWPVNTIEAQEDQGYGTPAGYLQLFRSYFPASSDHRGDDRKLQDAREHEQDAHQHPNVQEGDVRNSGNILPDSSKHRRQGQQRGHSHADTTWTKREKEIWKGRTIRRNVTWHIWHTRIQKKSILWHRFWS